MLHRSRIWTHFALIITFVLLLLSIGTVIAQDTQEAARVRIGYFAFDPKDFDTYADGELFPFTTSILNVGWSVPCFSVRCSTASPFFDFPAGNHSFAIVPQGKSLEARILGPIEFMLEAGHAYSLAIVGSIAANNLDMLIIDEMQILAGSDPKTVVMSTLVNNLAGVSALELKIGKNTEPIAYGRFSSKQYAPDQTIHFILKTPPTEEHKTIFVMNSVSIPAGISDLGALFGSYPGTYDKDYFFATNWGYSGKITILNGGTITVGKEVTGEIAAITQRMRYTLTLTTDSVLNLKASENGLKNKDTVLPDVYKFNPAIYVLDAKGKLLVWNNIFSFEAKLEGLALKAGTYQIEVGGSSDLVSGPFKLIVEAVKSR